MPTLEAQMQIEDDHNSRHGTYHAMGDKDHIVAGLHAIYTSSDPAKLKLSQAIRFAEANNLPKEIIKDGRVVCSLGVNPSHHPTDDDIDRGVNLWLQNAKTYYLRQATGQRGYDDWHD